MYSNTPGVDALLNACPNYVPTHLYCVHVVSLHCETQKVHVWHIEQTLSGESLGHETTPPKSQIQDTAIVKIYTTVAVLTCTLVWVLLCHLLVLASICCSFPNH